MTRGVLILAGAAGSGMVAGFAGQELRAVQVGALDANLGAAAVMTGVALVLVCLAAYVLGGDP